MTKDTEKIEDTEDTDDADETTVGGAWAAAKIVGTEEEGSLVAGFLNSNGIPAQVESLRVSEFPTDFGHLGEVHVMVPADRLQEAQLLLSQSDNAALPPDEPDDEPAGTEGPGTR